MVESARAAALCLAALGAVEQCNPQRVLKEKELLGPGPTPSPLEFKGKTQTKYILDHSRTHKIYTQSSLKNVLENEFQEVGNRIQGKDKRH